MAYSHTRHYASRYSVGEAAVLPFDILFFAENPSLALFEVQALFGSPLVPGGVIANSKHSWVVANAQVQLTRVADLTDVSGSHMPLATSAQELTGDWQGYRQRSANTSVSTPVGIAPTQELGASLHASGLFEGFIAISAKQPYHMVLGVFPDRVGAGNFIRFSYDDDAGQKHTLQVP